jgi:hypothetical protein
MTSWLQAVKIATQIAAALLWVPNWSKTGNKYEIKNSRLLRICDYEYYEYTRTHIQMFASLQGVGDKFINMKVKT